ncbi:hypothetical protein e1116g03.tmp0021 [Eimeria tenella]|uniref:Uncharacterized protein n=1 Tax=Eimeria tenella TaxID=5802 RepID=C8TE34_EIMTE|nr:hypothetical protein e1116g03.tmp0021 [Eimeria tenella]
MVTEASLAFASVSASLLSALFEQNLNLRATRITASGCLLPPSLSAKTSGVIQPFNAPIRDTFNLKALYVRSRNLDISTHPPRFTASQCEATLHANAKQIHMVPWTASHQDERPSSGRTLHCSEAAVLLTKRDTPTATSSIALKTFADFAHIK